MQTETVMSDAFSRAKRKGPAARLREMAVDAIEAEPGNFQGALGWFLEAVMTDAGAMAEMIGNDRLRACASVHLSQFWKAEHAEKPVSVKKHARSAPGAKTGGQKPGETHTVAAASGGGHTSAEAHELNAPAALSPERLAAERKAWKLSAASIMQTMRIDGTPLGECTVERVLASAGRDERHGRFKRRLCEGMQPYMVVGTYITDDAAQEMWEQTT
jgi:hypothetical protein